MAQELKLRASFDTREVGTGAKAAIDQLNAVEAAAQRSFRSTRNLAVEPAGLGGDLGAAPRAIDSALGADRIRLSATVSRETERTAVQMAKIRNLGSIFANTGIGPYIVQLKSVLDGMKAVAAAATLGSSLAAAGIALAAAPIAYVTSQLFKLRNIKNETADSSYANNEKTLGSVSKQFADLTGSGALRGDAAKDLAHRLAELQAESARGSRIKRVEDRIASGAAVSTGLGEFLRDMQSSLQTSYALEESSATQHAAAMAEIQRTQLEIEEAKLKQRYDRGLVEAGDYYEKLTALQGRSQYTKNQLLDLEEKQLQERLKRQENDYQASAETRARLAAIGDERAVLAEQFRATQNQNRILSQSVAGPAFRAQAVGVDDLARIGLFRGGGGESQVSFLRQQLAEAKEANRILRLVQTGIGNL